ncbi:hypothetical protein AB1L42_15430 [Thalassoglobus sp. JC818]|uniref:hypothetical protein n=1 Tax=Thalassoglobus sp. JC818 TaxID=3232136 RepID=UPI0034576FD9
MQHIQHLLDDDGEGDSRNRLTLPDVKTWLVDYLAMRGEEESRFSDQKGGDHWDMLVADYDSTHNTQLLAAYFSGSQVTFLAGTGNAQKVRSFAENDFPENVGDILPMLSQRFSAGKEWTVSLDEVIRWTQE